MKTRALTFILLLGGLCACDGGPDRSTPEVRLIEPATDTLVIGQSFRLLAEAEDAWQIAFMEVSLVYPSQREDPILYFIVENPARTSFFVLDTTLHIPDSVQPTALTEERVHLSVRADDDRNSSGQGRGMVAVPAPIP